MKKTKSVKNDLMTLKDYYTKNKNRLYRNEKRIIKNLIIIIEDKNEQF